MSGARGELTLVELQPVRKRVYAYVWEPNLNFVKPWWRREGSLVGNEHWISVRRDDEEVARCKYVLREHVPNDVVLDILAIEVAVPLRGQGIGRATLQLIRDANPGPRMTALNDDATSRGFWESVGWIREQLPDDPIYAGVERVTYSEP